MSDKGFDFREFCNVGMSSMAASVDDGTAGKDNTNCVMKQT